MTSLHTALFALVGVIIGALLQPIVHWLIAFQQRAAARIASQRKAEVELIQCFCEATSAVTVQLENMRQPETLKTTAEYRAAIDVLSGQLENMWTRSKTLSVEVADRKVRDLVSLAFTSQITFLRSEAETDMAFPVGQPDALVTADQIIEVWWKISKVA